MDYELVRLIQPDTDNWKHQQERLQKPKTRVLSLAPTPNFSGLLQSQHVKGINVIDVVTKRTYDPDTTLFFNRIPTVKGSEIFMNGDRSISIIKDGVEIGTVQLYGGTRRHVKSVTYYNPDKTRDFIEEYATDGNLFSRIWYSRDKAERIDFMNNSGKPVLRFYFYEGLINLVTVESPVTHRVLNRYDTLNDFYIDQVAKIVKKTDNVNISYLGVELTALQQAASTNSYYLDESPLDDNNQVKGYLLNILTDENKTISKVYMDEGAYNQLAFQNIPLDKAEVLDSQTD
ncbi:hypothetical protein [Levilactobacillus bambusae]|uniref:Uncharacterized protein n=1 Tax=Levilactobacillus bambusae TaxID=2024736 RepID=A0A2V1MXH4_9LACO|nr:hypothetical protein [Levilactobacillus bambusae]PWF99706.1 hypothetical protein DCM90_06505 [Levilactobacillus bambusae]